MNNTEISECVETLGMTIENIEEMLNEHRALITDAQADTFRSIGNDLRLVERKIADMNEPTDADALSECESILESALSEIEDVSADEENITTQQQMFFAQIYCLLEDAYFFLEE